MVYIERYAVYIDREDAPDDSEGRLLRLIANDLTKAEAIAYIEAEESLWGDEYSIWMEKIS